RGSESRPFFFQAEDGIRDFHVTGVQTCALPIFGVDGDASVDEGGPTIPLSALIDAVKRGRRYVRLSDGGFARITEELRKLVDKKIGRASCRGRASIAESGAALDTKNAAQTRTSR